MRTYPNTSIADPTTGTPATRKERRNDMDAFRVRDFRNERLLFRPVAATVLRTKMGDHPTVYTDVLVLSGSRKGKVFANVPVFNTHIVDILTAVLDSPFVQATAGTVEFHPEVEYGLPPKPTLAPFTSTEDIEDAALRADELNWGTATPATDKELLGWNLAQERKRNKLSQEDAAKLMDMAQPTLSSIESGSRNVAAFELRDFAKVYRTTMARLMP